MAFKKLALVFLILGYSSISALDMWQSLEQRLISLTNEVTEEVILGTLRIIFIPVIITLETIELCLDFPQKQLAEAIRQNKLYKVKILSYLGSMDDFFIGCAIRDSIANKHNEIVKFVLKCPSYKIEGFPSELDTSISYNNLEIFKFVLNNFKYDQDKLKGALQKALDYRRPSEYLTILVEILIDMGVNYETEFDQRVMHIIDIKLILKRYRKKITNKLYNEPIQYPHVLADIVSEYVC